jgi:hypothetical protein
MTIESPVTSGTPARVAPGIVNDPAPNGVPGTEPGHNGAGSGELPGSGHVDQSRRTMDWTARLVPLLRPMGYFLLSRSAVLFAALVSKWIAPSLNITKSLGSGWDGGWYLRIAQFGYPQHLINEGGGSRWAFFPGFPGVIRACVAVTGLTYPHAAIVVSFVFGLTSSVAIWLAVREVFGPLIADRSVLLYAFFPTAFVLSMAYTEGMFLTAAALCLFALSRRMWMTASAFAVVASLTRSFGVVLIACVAIAAIPVIVRERRIRPLVALALSPLGFIGWMAYSWNVTGTPLAFLKAEKYWGNSHFVWFATPFRSLRHLFSGVHAFTVAPDVLAAAALVFAVVGLALLVQIHRRGTRIPLVWWVFTIGSVLGMLSPYWPTSVLRYSMAVFPFFAAVAWKLRPAWMGSVVGVLAASQGALAVVILVGLVHPYVAPLAP